MITYWAQSVRPTLKSIKATKDRKNFPQRLYTNLTCSTPTPYCLVHSLFQYLRLSAGSYCPSIIIYFKPKHTYVHCLHISLFIHSNFVSCESQSDLHKACMSRATLPSSTALAFLYPPMRKFLKSSFFLLLGGMYMDAILLPLFLLANSHVLSSFYTLSHHLFSLVYTCNTNTLANLFKFDSSRNGV